MQKRFTIIGITLLVALLTVLFSACAEEPESPPTPPTSGVDVLNFKVGSKPGAIVCARSGIVWVANAGDNNVMKIRTSDGSCLGTYAVGKNPSALVFDGTNIWVANGDDNTVTKIKASDGTNLGTYPVGPAPSALAFDDMNIWVASRINNNAMKISAEDGTVVGNYEVGLRPCALAFDGENIWVANAEDDTVTKLRASDGVELFTCGVGDQPVDLLCQEGAVTNPNAELIVANYMDNTVMLLSISDGSVKDTFSKFGDHQLMGPTAIAQHADRTVWVATWIDDMVSLVTPSDDISYKVGNHPRDLVFDEATNTFWVTNQGDDSISKVTVSW